MKPLRVSPYIRHDGALVAEWVLSNGYETKTVVVVYGHGHEAALLMGDHAEKLRLVANDGLRDAPRPGGR